MATARFPVPIAEAGAFDPDLWRATARIAAVEGAADGIALTFAPISTWPAIPGGRIVEIPGEDPGWPRVRAAKVTASRTVTWRSRQLAATAKHLAAYGAVTAGREYAPFELSERSLHEIYCRRSRKPSQPVLPGSCRPSTTWPGAETPIARAPRTRARGWGFVGIYVSDYAAIAELVIQGVAADLTEAARTGARAGASTSI